MVELVSATASIIAAGAAIYLLVVQLRRWRAEDVSNVMSVTTITARPLVSSTWRHCMVTIENKSGGYLLIDRVKATRPFRAKLARSRPDDTHMRGPPPSTGLRAIHAATEIAARGSKSLEFFIALPSAPDDAGKSYTLKIYLHQEFPLRRSWAVRVDGAVDRAATKFDLDR